MPESQYTKELLKELQSRPLWDKVQITQSRIIQWYNYWDGNVYVSFSGGKDSTVLLHLVRQIFPDVPAVYSNTGLEYPEIQAFVKKFDNVTILRPEMRFDEVMTEYGYPLISKETAEAIYYARRKVGKTPPENERNCKDSVLPQMPAHGHRTSQTLGATERSALRGEAGGLHWKETHNRRGELLGQRMDSREGYNLNVPTERNHGVQYRRRQFTGVEPTTLVGNSDTHDFQKSIFNKEKWLPLCRDLPVRISHKCCDVMKKRPIKAYAKTNHRKPYIGTMTEESRLRKQAWLRNGCNAFEGANVSSQPMSFWTEQDVLEYIRVTGLEIAPVYGDIVTVDKDGYEYKPECAGCKLKTTGCTRTGCVYCPFGMHLEKGETRFQRLAKTHQKQYDFCMRGGMWIDNPDYDPTYDGKPDEIGWVDWNPKKIWVPGNGGLGMRKVFDMVNEIYGKDFYRYE